MSSPEYQLLLSTAPDEAVANRLATQLVKLKLAACVNLLSQTSSIYQWQGQLEKSQEVMMLIKSVAKNFDAIELFFEKNHPYDVPELISCNINQVSASYGQWLATNIETKS